MECMESHKNHIKIMVYNGPFLLFLGDVELVRGRECCARGSSIPLRFQAKVGLTFQNSIFILDSLIFISFHFKFKICIKEKRHSKDEKCYIGP